MAPTGQSSSSTEARFRTLSGRGLSEDEVELGRIVGVFGVRGEVRVHLHNREGSVLLDDPWDVILVSPDGSRRTTRLSCRSGAGKRILGRLDGLSDREVAAGLKGTLIAVARADLPPPDSGEFYVADLQGLTVLVDDEARGSVVDVHHTAAGDLIELSLGTEVHFVPFADPAIGKIDLDRGTLTLDPRILAEDDED